MSDESSLDESEWNGEGDIGSWDSEDDLALLISQLCRICGEACDDLVECFGEKGKEMMLVEKIHTHLPIKVTEEDLLPVNVCTACIAKVEMCHELVINCLEADGKMRALLGFDTPGYEEQYNYERSGSPDSYVSKSQEDDDGDAESNLKELENEENNYKGTPKECRPAVGKNKIGRQEDRTTYKVIMLKMKKTSEISPETQLKQALTYLELGVKSTKEASTSEPKKNLLEKTDNNSSTSLEPIKNPEVIEKQATEDKNEKPEEQRDLKEDTYFLECEDVNYECIYCDENVMGKSNFVIHQKTVHNNEVFSCHRCELVYELQEDFDEHVRSHENEKSTSSDVENSTQSKSTEVLNENGKRKNDSSSEQVAKKLKIDKLFPLTESAMKQIKTDSDEVFWKCKVWQCKLCGDISLNKQEWRVHECEAKELQCPLCNDATLFTSGQELEAHYQSIHMEDKQKEQTNVQSRPAQEAKNQCSSCGKVHTPYAQLSQHCKTQMGQFKCPDCERTFHRQTNLANHLRKHKTESGFTCRICLETFSNRGELLTHRRNHTREELLGMKPLNVKEEDVDEPEVEDDSGGAFKCPICFRCFQTRDKLDGHIALHTDCSFPCHICGKVLSKKNTLEYHLRTHTGEKPYTCSMCPGAFQSRVGLIVHERIHTGEKPYQCDQCEMAFRCRATLNQHKVVHSEERPFQCLHCGRGFRRRDTLDTHIRTHTDERPYACRICGRAFRQKGDCSKHEKTHNKQSKSVLLFAEGDATNIYTCPLCGQMYELKEDLDHHYENEHTPEEKASSIVIINSENVITIPGIATVGDDTQGLVLHELT